jgi:hypothetical protein
VVLHVKVTMKSGAAVRFRAKKLTLKENGLGQTTKLEWTKTRFGANLFDIRLEEISAITIRRWVW